MMTTSEVARRLGISPRAVRKRDDELHPVRVDGDRRFDPEVIERVAAERDHRRDLRSGRIR